MKDGVGFPAGSGCRQLHAEGVILGSHPFLVLVALGKAGSVLICGCSTDGMKASVDWSRYPLSARWGCVYSGALAGPAGCRLNTRLTERAIFPQRPPGPKLGRLKPCQ